LKNAQNTVRSIKKTRAEIPQKIPLSCRGSANKMNINRAQLKEGNSNETCDLYIVSPLVAFIWSNLKKVNEI